MDGCDTDIHFVSLWIPIIDELRFSNREPMLDVIGGAGTFATLGARIFSPPPKSRSVGWIALAGENDFPPDAEELLKGWDISLELRKLPGQQTTKALLQYETSTFGPKIFHYMAPPLPLSARTLESTPMLAASSFHLFGSPIAISKTVPELLALRQAASIERSPLFIFEPGPLFCDPPNLPSVIEAAKLVDVLSPNHIELAKLCGERDESKLTQDFLEQLAARFVMSGIGWDGNGVIVIRAGERGCLLASSMMETCKWFPAYYDPEWRRDDTTNKIIDATGAGNAFLGAYAKSLVESGCHDEAAMRGSIAASFAIEQIGLPTLRKVDEGVETWNGDTAWERLEQYRQMTEKEKGTRT